MEGKLLHEEVEKRKRKLKCTWTVLDQLPGRPDNRMPLLDDKSKKFTFGVDTRLLSISQRRDLFDWVEETFDPDLYKITGEFKAYMWFEQEKHRTLLIMKWS